MMDTPNEHSHDTEESVDWDDLDHDDSERAWKNGEPFTGTAHCFNVFNGRLCATYQMLSGRNHGLYEEYDENENVIERGEYRNHYPFGVWRYWNSAGDLIREESYEDGICVVTKERDEHGSMIVTKTYDLEADPDILVRLTRQFIAAFIEERSEVSVPYYRSSSPKPKEPGLWERIRGFFASFWR